VIRFADIALSPTDTSYAGKSAAALGFFATVDMVPRKRQTTKAKIASTIDPHPRHFYPLAGAGLQPRCRLFQGRQPTA
jgi:hypothetical protein